MTKPLTDHEPGTDTAAAPDALDGDLADTDPAGTDTEADPNADLLAIVQRMRTVRLPRRLALETLTNACCADNGRFD